MTPYKMIDIKGKDWAEIFDECDGFWIDGKELCPMVECSIEEAEFIANKDRTKEFRETLRIAKEELAKK